MRTKTLHGVTVGETWRHHSGRFYRVLGFANEATTNPVDFPVTVIYQGDNLRVWCRPLTDFLHRFRKEDVN